MALISLSDLLAKAEAATPGPWDIQPDSSKGKDEYWGYWHRVGPIYFTGKTTNNNSEFIAAASPHIVKALVEALRETIDAYGYIHGSTWAPNSTWEQVLAEHGLKP